MTPQDIFPFAPVDAESIAKKQQHLAEAELDLKQFEAWRKNRDLFPNVWWHRSAGKELREEIKLIKKWLKCVKPAPTSIPQ